MRRRFVGDHDHSHASVHEAVHRVEASTASGGALRVRLPDNAVTVSFAQSADEANNLADAYRRFHAKNVGVEDILRTKDNAVMLWQLHPSAPDESNVEDCLK
jgi:hypothetical protein